MCLQLTLFLTRLYLRIKKCICNDLALHTILELYVAKFLTVLEHRIALTVASVTAPCHPPSARVAYLVGWDLHVTTTAPMVYSSLWTAVTVLAMRVTLVSDVIASVRDTGRC